MTTASPSAPAQYTKTLVHPELGEITVDCDVMTTDRGDLRLVVFTAAPGSAAAAHLQTPGRSVQSQRLDGA